MIKSNTMTNEQIRALGNLLEFYYSDLMYIREFHRHKTGLLDSKSYLQKTDGTFKSFINEYRVARNVDKTKTDILLRLTMDWVSRKNCNNVDKFAKHLQASKLTYGKLTTSLASKILFLNNPWEILPFDNLTKHAVGLNVNNYSKYTALTKDFKTNNFVEIEYCLLTINEPLTIIESQFENNIRDIKTIRNNRYLDKLLWSIGRSK